MVAGVLEGEVLVVVVVVVDRVSVGHELSVVEHERLGNCLHVLISQVLLVTVAHDGGLELLVVEVVKPEFLLLFVHKLFDFTGTWNFKFSFA